MGHCVGVQKASVFCVFQGQQPAHSQLYFMICRFRKLICYKVKLPEFYSRKKWGWDSSGQHHLVGGALGCSLLYSSTAGVTKISVLPRSLWSSTQWVMPRFCVSAALVTQNENRNLMENFTSDMTKGPCFHTNPRSSVTWRLLCWVLLFPCSVWVWLFRVLSLEQCSELRRFSLCGSRTWTALQS